ncbi:MAG: heterodisulfide reductase-related iron-sulfur binding cluster [Actinomycetes bacterium]
MSATDTTTSTDANDTAVPGPKRLQPPQIAIVVGVGIALIVALSGVAAGLVFKFEDASPVKREVFEGIPGWIKLAFYTVIPVMFIYGAVMFSYRMRNWQRGNPDKRDITPKNAKRRLERLRGGLYMQTLLRDPAAGIMHSMIYFGFLILLAVTTVLEVNHQLPDQAKFLHGDVYRAYAFVGDFAGLVFTAGVVWAIVRRYVQKPYRIRIKSKPEHAVILGVLLAIGVTGFAAEMFRIAAEGRPSFEKFSFVGYPLSGLVDGLSTVEGWHTAMWVLHVLTFIAFLVILPTTMLRHIFTSPLNIYLADKDRPKGAMRAMPNLMETELETFGASVVEDFTWKQLLDTDACTMCGRCTSVCPAHATGKPLDPREIVLKTGEVMSATGSPVVSPPIGVDKEITVAANSLFERITAEEVWSCTSCKACDENCPVNIEILDKILDMRRYLTLMESDFPTELGNAFRAMENSGNPWGMSQSERADWAKDLDGIEIIDGGDPFTAEYLYWVGCAGSFDDKNRKVTQAMAKLMQRSEISFAILGPAENCTGDPARRSGNEYIFQMLAMQNIETLDSMGVRKIITQCPHCFNTLSNEYPQLGGHYEVIHHSQFLEELIDSGRLDMSGAKLEERVVYHDSCYLGRHNDVYMAPRNVIGHLKGIEIVEADRNGTKGMCCGAGGARMWMEEHIGKQVNVERSQELLATGATRIATACPFCYVMIDDGVKAQGVEEEQVKVGDLAMHVLEALENAEPLAQNPLEQTS